MAIDATSVRKGIGVFIAFKGLLLAAEPGHVALHMTALLPWEVASIGIAGSLVAGPLFIASGFLLIVSVAPRLPLALGSFVLMCLAVVGLTGYRDLSGEPCNCIGMGPTSGTALIVHYTVVGLLSVLAVALSPYVEARISPRRAVRVALVVVLLVSTGVIGVVRAMRQTRSTIANCGVVVFPPVEVLGVDEELTSGSYLIFVFDPRCSHCQSSLTSLNALAADRSLPRIIGLSHARLRDQRLFLRANGSSFESGHVSHQDFMWLSDGRLPRTLLVENGIIASTWSETVPIAREVRRSGPGSRAGT